MTDPASPAAQPPPAHTDASRVLHLSTLLKRPLADRTGRPLGRLADVIARLRGTDYPLITGVVVGVGGRRLFVPIEQIESFGGEGGGAGGGVGGGESDDTVVRLRSAKVDLRPFERREGEVLLRADVLGHRLIDVTEVHLVRASDVELAWRDGQWLLSCVDTHRPHRLLGLFGDRSAGRSCRDWKSFEPLIGHVRSALDRRPFARIRGLRPAEIADLIEDASKDEEREILGHVHQDPELEAEVFEELDEDLASRLLGARTDEDVAGVLARMGADDAADAIADLPQERRRPVLDLLPPAQRAKVLTLMGFNPDSAGGLMSVDFLARPARTPTGEVLSAVREAHGIQPEALSSVFAIDDEGRLGGVARLVPLLRADRGTPLGQIAEPDPVRVGADTDLVDVALLMADFNLTVLPVVDERRALLGVITVDDVLEATLPEDWRRRETAPPPDGPWAAGEREAVVPADGREPGP